jgi:signal peptidase I
MINNNPRAVAPPNMPRPVEPRHPQRPSNSSRKESFRSVLSTAAVLLIAPIIAIFLTMFVFQSYQVDGESMETTLSHNDRLIVWKLPKTFSRITGNDYIPKRGDVVVFTEPTLSQFGQDPGKQLIKRVVGLPGERIVVRDKVLTVYNPEHPGGFQPDASLPYGSAIGETPIEDEWNVRTGQIFVVGDNRSNSLDSRTFGPVDVENVVGKLIVRVLPLSKITRF